MIASEIDETQQLTTRASLQAKGAPDHGNKLLFVPTFPWPLQAGGGSDEEGSSERLSQQDAEEAECSGGESVREEADRELGFSWICMCLLADLWSSRGTQSGHCGLAAVLRNANRLSNRIAPTPTLLLDHQGAGSTVGKQHRKKRQSCTSLDLCAHTF